MSPSWTEVDQLLELERAAAQRGRDFDQFLTHEDEVEHIACRCLQAYQLLGGVILTLPAWRAKARQLLSAGNPAGRTA